MTFNEWFLALHLAMDKQSSQDRHIIMVVACIMYVPRRQASGEANRRSAVSLSSDVDSGLKVPRRDSKGGSEKARARDEG